MKVWIDQDLCTGDGLCEEIAPDVFTLLDDGLAYVKEGDKVFSDPGGAEGLASARGHGRGDDRVGRGVPRRVHLHRGRLTRLVARSRLRARTAFALGLSDATGPSARSCPRCHSARHVAPRAQLGCRGAVSASTSAGEHGVELGVGERVGGGRRGRGRRRTATPTTSPSASTTGAPESPGCGDGGEHEHVALGRRACGRCRCRVRRSARRCAPATRAADRRPGGRTPSPRSSTWPSPRASGGEAEPGDAQHREVAVRGRSATTVGVEAAAVGRSTRRSRAPPRPRARSSRRGSWRDDEPGALLDPVARLALDLHDRRRDARRPRRPGCRRSGGVPGVG